jgi:hypothetical protein
VCSSDLRETAVVHPALAVSAVMIPLEMAQSPDAMMHLVAPDPLAASAPDGQVHRARLLAIAERLVHRVMMIATALPVTMIRLLTRMRPPVSSIALRGAS